jgi:peptide-methionine (R)-S-oxide reductase
MYVCAGCGTPLFSSDTKFDSGTGWPSFSSPAEKENVEEKSDRSLLMKRVEILCKKCGGHLGHVFEDGPQPTGLRYCVNSLSLSFKKGDENKASVEPKD